MNLFCFTLEGSSESIYEPAHSQTLKDVLPKYQFSPLLRRRPDWAGSDPSISCERHQSATRSKRTNRRSCVPSSSLDGETSEGDVNHSCWMSGHSPQQKTPQGKETHKALLQNGKLASGGGGKAREAEPAPKGAECAAGVESASATRRLRKLQSLVATKKAGGKGRSSSGNNSPVSDVWSGSGPLLTCMGLGRRTEKPPASPRRQPRLREDSEDEVAVWIPRISVPVPPPWSPSESVGTPFHHTCHLPGHQRRAGGGNYSLPRASEWDRFESLIQELDSKQADLSPPQMIRSITDLHLTHNTLTRFGRFGTVAQNGASAGTREDGSSAPEQNGESSRPADGQIASAEKTPTAASVSEVGGPDLCVGSVESLLSLLSLHSGHSSSSGVTSGSDLSGSRGSLRPEDEPAGGAVFCGRARVHTGFVPSPYDTESLTLKVGDVIDIIARPAMGIWTGRLDDKVGNFKFIYVDVLTEAGGGRSLGLKDECRSTVHEVLRRLSLEEYASALQLAGYQTVDDLMRLRERHLMRLNVTDPEHRRRLLAAVQSLQQLCYSGPEVGAPGDNAKADGGVCPRDSGCHSSAEESDPHCERPAPAGGDAYGSSA